MEFCEKWIWLPAKKYPKYQSASYSSLTDVNKGEYAVAEFEKKYVYDKKITSVKLRFCGDTTFRLFCNGKTVATGPATAPGDFLNNNMPRNEFYSLQSEIFPNSNELHFFARVALSPVAMCEYSMGHGGFMLSAQIIFEDGTKTVVYTDKSWLVRKNGAYASPFEYDGNVLPDEYTNAEEIPNIWHTEVAPIPVRSEHEILPLNDACIILEPNEEKKTELEFDMIYAGFFHVLAETDGKLEINARFKELNDEKGHSERIVFDGSDEYIGFQLHSVSNIELCIKNETCDAAKVQINIIATHYPVVSESKTLTDDAEMNKVLKVCAHTLKYCRQLHHLDSPAHCEPLACTGDYYIESLMTAFSYGDMALCEFDAIRTASIIRNNSGVMFHTSYSLIWVNMLYDLYSFTGNLSLLECCEDAVLILLEKFESYVGDNGIIETPPNFMFVDWLYIDGCSLHHPPKALGQTILNMFYISALSAAEKIFYALSENEMARYVENKRGKLKQNVNTLLYDKEKGMYFEGLNTPTPNELIGTYMPQNTDKRYFLKHSNILAVYSGACVGDEAKALIEKIMSDECPGEYQPYFAHFLFEAIFKAGMCEEYTRLVAEKWKKPIAECDKGLAEGFIQPEPSYSFDHSHAWGGTVLYSLPKAMLGLNMIEAGYKKIELAPSLIGFKTAKVEIPTPYGQIVCSMEKGKIPKISVPDKIKVVLKNEAELC